MAEREVVLDQPVVIDEHDEALRKATDRADRAEAELAKLKHAPVKHTEPTGDGEAELRNDSMMAHLLDSLNDGKDIGHYGRLVFAMVARHFMPHDEVMAWMMKDKDVDEEKARLMLVQVEGKDYSPPRRDKILSYPELNRTSPSCRMPMIQTAETSIAT